MSPRQRFRVCVCSFFAGTCANEGYGWLFFSRNEKCFSVWEAIRRGMEEEAKIMGIMPGACYSAEGGRCTFLSFPLLCYVREKPISGLSRSS